MSKQFKQYLLPTIITLSALSVSLSAAFYSVTGLSKLFAGASTEVMIMAGSLEVAKLVIASLLYQYWGKLSKILRAYLTSAAAILVIVTSLGIYGFLSSAYQSTYSKLEVATNKIEYLQEKADFYQEDVARYDVELQSTLDNINNLSKARASQVQTRGEDGQIITSVSTVELRMAQQRLAIEEENRKETLQRRSEASDSLQKYKLAVLEASNNSELSGELGPLQYVSTLTGLPMNKVINWLVLIIIFVFDPLAVSLVIAANFAFNQIRSKKEVVVEEPFTLQVPENPIKPHPSSFVKEVVDSKVEEEKPVEKKTTVSKLIDRVLQKTPSKLRVLFKDGTEGWVPKRNVKK